MENSGRNFVELQGVLQDAKFTYTDNGYARFKGTVAVPVRVRNKGGEDKEVKEFVSVCAWGNLAESMADLQNGEWVKVQGTIQKRSYEAKCSCGTPTKKYWTDVNLTNFVVL